MDRKSNENLFIVGFLYAKLHPFMQTPTPALPARGRGKKGKPILKRRRSAKKLSCLNISKLQTHAKSNFPPPCGEGLRVGVRIKMGAFDKSRTGLFAIFFSQTLLRAVT